MLPYKTDKIGEIIKDNTYVGRGIIVGKTADGKKAATAYFIMGRSENSRNRVFVENGEEVIIHPYDASKVEDPSLIIYSPIRVIENNLITGMLKVSLDRRPDAAPLVINRHSVKLLKDAHIRVEKEELEALKGIE